MKGSNLLAYALLLLAILGCSLPQTNNNNNSSSPSPSPAASGSPQVKADGKSSPAATDTPAAAGVTMAGFSQLKTGMTYEQAVKVLGKEGTEMSSNEIGGTKTVMYQWEGDGLGATMTAMFQNNKLISKSQFGLK